MEIIFFLCKKLSVVLPHVQNEITSNQEPFFVVFLNMYKYQCSTFACIHTQKSDACLLVYTLYSGATYCSLRIPVVPCTFEPRHKAPASEEITLESSSQLSYFPVRWQCQQTDNMRNLKTYPFFKDTNNRLHTFFS